MRISDWSSDVCSSDLIQGHWQFIAPILVGLVQSRRVRATIGRHFLINECAQFDNLERQLTADRVHFLAAPDRRQQVFVPLTDGDCGADVLHVSAQKLANSPFEKLSWPACSARHRGGRKTALTRQVGQPLRSEEHTSELQSLMRISYAV